jgi:hypothetical protein
MRARHGMGREERPKVLRMSDIELTPEERTASEVLGPYDRHSGMTFAQWLRVGRVILAAKEGKGDKDG